MPLPVGLVCDPHIKNAKQTLQCMEGSAPAQDGMPSSAWRAGGALAAEASQQLIEAMFRWQLSPGLQDVLHVFVPMVDCAGPHDPISAAPTRPLALKDAGLPIATTVLLRAVRPVFSASVAEEQAWAHFRPRLR